MWPSASPGPPLPTLPMRDSREGTGIEAWDNDKDTLEQEKDDY